MRGALAFFRCLPRVEAAPAETALRLIWNCPADLAEAAARACAENPGAPEEPLRRLAADRPILEDWLMRMDQWRDRAAKEKPWKLIERWMEAYGATSALEKLKNTAVFHSSMSELLAALALGQEADVRRAAGRGWEAGAVRLMTLHGAKGLEFPAVIVAGVRDGVLPLQSQGRASDPEEERRLLFVGMTRAREELILTSGGEPSPFLADLPERVVRETIRKRARPAEQLSLF